MLNFVTLILGSLTVGFGIMSLIAGGSVGWITIPLGAGMMGWSIMMEGNNR